ncbi:hypothetical protein AB0K09_13145 [Streptomyces sp. NPDC049577]|uniref:hypothetical protein n=1 Tax=Streptomyces sp. NPDC049577 TaxID=3155153 RepID=UPI0034288135
MTVMVHSRGAAWTRELYQETFDRAVPDPDDPPAGLIAHFAGPGEEGGWQVVEVWESVEAFHGFLEKAVLPVARDLKAPPFDSSTVEIHNALIP